MVTEEQIIQRRVKFAQQFVAQGASIPQAVKLSGVAESTAQRRGRAYDPLASVIQASVPPPSQPIVVSNLSNIFASPPPSQPLIASNLLNIFASPQPAPVPAPKASKSFVTIGGNVFSESEYRTAKRKSSPCGDFAPYAQEHTGLMRTFCTAADFGAKSQGVNYVHLVKHGGVVNVRKFHFQKQRSFRKKYFNFYFYTCLSRHHIASLVYLTTIVQRRMFHRSNQKGFQDHLSHFQESVS